MPLSQQLLSPLHPRGNVKNGHILISPGSYITLTPVNLIRPSTEISMKAKHDYHYEETKFANDSQLDFPCWDQPRSKNAKKASIFVSCTTKLRLVGNW